MKKKPAVSRKSRPAPRSTVTTAATFPAAGAKTTTRRRAAPAAAPAHVSPCDLTDDDRILLERQVEHFRRVTADPRTRAFRTDAADLWPFFLARLPAELRRVYTCTACRHFVEEYGGLVAIDEAGRATSLFWGEGVDAHGYSSVVDAMRRRVEAAKVTGPFLTSATTWGTPVTGPWSHFGAEAPAHLVYRSRGLKSAKQAEAEQVEDYKMLSAALADYGPAIARAVSDLVRHAAGRMVDGAKVAPVAEWFLGLHLRLLEAKVPQVRLGLKWRAVADAPAGFCHVRSTMVGTLLAEVAAATDAAVIVERFNSKMNPNAYRRPSAPVTTGAVEAAERAFAAAGLGPALARRFARLEEAEALWRPPVRTAATDGGLFAHLRRDAGRQVEAAVILDPITVTWEKFRRVVLPDAAEVLYAAEPARRAYYALTTAADPEAPPILKWDRPDHRNPASWYVYAKGSTPAEFGLAVRTWCRVTAVCLLPPSWCGAAGPEEGAVFLLEGTRDQEPQKGMGFFPGQLRSDLHAHRSVMEAYAQSAGVAQGDLATACGVGFPKGAPWLGPLHFAVTTTAGGRYAYRLDRWD